MKISVALCTYNGEKFLKEQLTSILQQSKAVHEIVVCDDLSQDATLQILQEFKQKFPELFIIKVNEHNLRSVKNFEKAITSCSGDLIFLSDQDDIWKADKVEKMVDKMNQNPHIAVICSSAEIIDESGKVLNALTVWDIPFMAKKKEVQINYFTLLSRIQNIATGATMCLRKDFAQQALPFPTVSGLHHDEWLALLASQQGKFEIMPEKLISYRLHQNQQVGGVMFKNRSTEIQKQIENFSVYAAKPSFRVLKKRLKRLSSAYRKYQKISEAGFEKAWMKKEMRDIIADFNINKNLMAQKFPLQNFILSLADKKNNKRSID